MCWEGRSKENWLSETCFCLFDHCEFLPFHLKPYSSSFLQRLQVMSLLIKSCKFVCLNVQIIKYLAATQVNFVNDENFLLFSWLKVFPVAIFQTWIKPNVSPLSELNVQPLSCQWQWCTFRVNNLTMNLCTWIKCTWNKTFNPHHACVELELHLQLMIEDRLILQRKKATGLLCDTDLVKQRC